MRLMPFFVVQCSLMDESAILIGADFRGATPPLEDMICRAMNVIWDTIMFDGTVQSGPYFGEWKSISK